MRMVHKLCRMLCAALVWALPLMGPGCASNAPPDPAVSAPERSVSSTEAASAGPAPTATPPADPARRAAQPAAPTGMTEEDLLQAPAAGGVGPTQDVISDAPDASPNGVAAPVDSLPVVALDTDRLHLRAAFVDFTAPNEDVDPQAAAFFRERLTQQLKAACSKRLDLLLPGDPDFPAMLNHLPRDQFGNLNSFELTTLARTNGLNAVITGYLIDVRLFNEIQGMLWYKSPEGMLRVAIHAAIYDAETGTKLLDKNYIFKKSVEELAPGAAPKVRKEDWPVLEEGLREIADQMHEDLCDRMEDQPWRTFVVGSEDNRVMLAAGAFSGLVPGNTLSIFNSQIIDGLNNQQFFLTGERLGRIQILKVNPDYSEAVLLEGLKPGLYGVAKPE